MIHLVRHDVVTMWQSIHPIATQRDDRGEGFSAAKFAPLNTAIAI
jgi:hypothetical protein